jgi:Zn-dependent protease
VLHLGSIRGTTIDVDFSFFILILLFVVLRYNPQQGFHFALLWIPIVFVSVLVHELAHAAAIGLFGHGSSQIILGGMGGVTINARKAKPWQDMLISLAGPGSSFLLWIASVWIYYNIPVAHTDPMLKEFLPRFAWANRVWGLFNLIPVPPLDGGHAVRSFFSTFLRDRTSFVISTWVALIGGGAVAVYAFMAGEWFVAFYIAWFVFMAFQRWQDFQKYGTPQD